MGPNIRKSQEIHMQHDNHIHAMINKQSETYHINYIIHTIHIVLFKVFEHIMYKFEIINPRGVMKNLGEDNTLPIVAS